jgi:NADPH-dependent glutamate synthase beta subunit-like oxidoreductase
MRVIGRLNDRIHDYGEVEQTLNEKDRALQASRCMDCGIPFCHWGCPVGSKIPEWQDAIYQGTERMKLITYYIQQTVSRKLQGEFVLLRAKNRVF